MELRAKNLTKDYPGTRALDNVSVSLESGRCYALLGKNGSGKSTFVKLFAGVILPSDGELYLDDEKLDFSSPQDAYNKGIVTVHQEMSLVPGLTVAENIFLNRMPKKNGLINWGQAYADAAKLLEVMDVDISPRSIVKDLSMWQQQICEITKAMSIDPRVLMLDEPTSALAQNEVSQLHNVVNRLKREKDIIIIYITHKLQELTAIADDIIVLRDGKLIGQERMDNVTHLDIINMMFGETEQKEKPSDIKAGRKVLMEVKNLERENCFSDINFKLYDGEVLGIAGMLGSGRSELLRSIFGADSFDSGEIYVDGELVKRTNISNMKAKGLAMTPEDRQTEGVILIHPIRDNLCYASMDRSSKGIVENKAMRNSLANQQVDNLQIRIGSLDDPVRSLSGGNQQKVVVGNWLNTQPKIMMFDEPTRGIDVNAKQQIFEIMWEQSRKGISSIFVSSELEELMEVCNRIIVMHLGRFVGEFNPEDGNINELYAFAMSGKQPETLEVSHG